ncbi:MAG: polysaccharide pyruvyl transferase family protein [Sporomusaceae bacterium]|jgi:colanic acid/amylovoran biosynthesis protein|nr:polysaccharide pyruvyl transferase family protein [Sporomusaceae bacterium]
MRILVIGLATLHMGRLEKGNIGNYYVIEPFFRQLHRVFPDADIATTFQLSDQFCKNEKVTSLPMSLYYSWSANDLNIALKEFALAKIFNETGNLLEKTPFIAEVLAADLVIDLSGDMWGDNADLAGENRFLVNLLKDKVVQLLNIPIAMLAGSPGSFENEKLKKFAQDVYIDFDLVSNREPIATKILQENGFDLTKTIDSYCPSFLFEPVEQKTVKEILKKENIPEHRPVIGFTFCGFNMPVGPYTKWPRDDSEYLNYVQTIEYLINKLNATVVLISHSNGFTTDGKFTSIHGRDYPLLKQIQDLILKRAKIDATKLILIDTIYTPAETKGIIGSFDLFISGRAHGAIAALSQSVPCVILNYINGPVAHKLLGFAMTAGMDAYVADSASLADILEKINACYLNREKIAASLQNNNIAIKKKIAQDFEQLKTILPSMTSA